ncbi:protein asteroid homolog 1-like isoform X1 [Erpetoichthys calabaricus]|uniref:protein asteroid homolog 1-like isoform X1 n=1 Tax=Erpetoichthys calabaricus TaxID=27687 RepID=UPI002234E8E9|nr:protein asteroid homolog 1-like isoform X1 [Erpetoichthys calabaricus]XP_051791608.1 protein asteroid homolog 1-like isoform X1 [Erpetoichthys calabaricus]
MGIHGLWSYVASNSEFFSDLKLSRMKIIIDGNSLYHRLYFTSGINQQHGGEYDAFADIVHRFFDALFVCNVKPYVVLDGGCDYTNKKFETLKQRAQERIRAAHCSSMGSHGCVLPLLAREVFIQVLSRLQIPFVQCLSEADWEIACLASQWAYPVLTMDSDFCIFNLSAGFCPLVNFDWNRIKKCKQTSQLYIPAKCFLLDKLCRYFDKLNKDLLPLFAVMIGNDYININAMDTFFSRVTFPGSSNLKRDTHARIHGLLHWLSTFGNPKEAIEKVVECLHERDRDAVRECLCSSMKEYKLSASQLADYFTSGVSLSSVPRVMDVLPPWVVKALGKAELAPYIIDVLVLQRVFLIPQVENSRLSSSHMCSLPIRQVLYGLLLRAKRQSSTASGEGVAIKDKVHQVEEFSRQDVALKKSLIQAVVPASTESVLLENIVTVPASVCRQVLLETLGVTSSVAKTVPSHLSLAASVTSYWLTHSNPKPSLLHLQAVLLGIVYGELCRITKTADPAASHEDVKTTCWALQKLHRIPRWSLNVDVDVAHIFSQWQTSLQMSFYLNQVLRCPLQEPEIQWLYSGTFMHQMFRQLNSKATPESLLSGSALASGLYENLLTAVTSELPLDFFHPKKRGKKSAAQKKDSKSKMSKNESKKSLQNTDNRFALLSLDED